MAKPEKLSSCSFPDSSHPHHRVSSKTNMHRDSKSHGYHPPLGRSYSGATCGMHSESLQQSLIAVRSLLYSIRFQDDKRPVCDTPSCGAAAICPTEQGVHKIDGSRSVRALRYTVTVKIWACTIQRPTNARFAIQAPNYSAIARACCAAG